MGIYFIADTHLGHRSIITHCGRPFATVTEMDESIVDGINAVVRETDTLYHLGDLGWFDCDIESYLDRIACKRIVLIRGNHDDRGAVSRLVASGKIKEVHDLLYLKDHGVKLTLCHYPFHSWKRGTIHLHGHTHGSIERKPWRIDVGWDALGRVGNRPVSLAWVAEQAMIDGAPGMY